MGKDKKAKAPVTLGAGGLAGAIGAYSSSPATGPSLLSAVLGDSSLDGEAQVLLKKLGKRDTTTKLKALVELFDWLSSPGNTIVELNLREVMPPVDAATTAAPSALSCVWAKVTRLSNVSSVPPLRLALLLAPPRHRRLARLVKLLPFGVPPGVSDNLGAFDAEGRQLLRGEDHRVAVVHVAPREAPAPAGVVHVGPAAGGSVVGHVPLVLGHRGGGRSLRRGSVASCVG